ncbi:MAG: PDZ domain-containing protein [Chromatiaceae bacterium]|nr:MAG: PDZ domain-containing protein [Chromatiaceae bacterium]
MTRKTQPLLVPISLSALTFAIGLGTGSLLASHPSDGPAGAATAPDPSRDPPATATPAAGTAALVGAAQPTASSATDPATTANPDPELLARVEHLSEGWGRMEAELAELRARLAVLERRPSPVETAASEAERRRALRPRTPEQQRDALLRAGVRLQQAEDILWRRSQLALERLELRDQAIREGWIGSEQFREEMRRISGQQVSLRDELDPNIYDRYLFETGQDNRVRIDSVIAGSLGEDIGLMPGDLVEAYNEQPIFDPGELRTATTVGERGELVPVRIRRNNQPLELWLPRGPIGIRLDTDRIAP